MRKMEHTHQEGADIYTLTGPVTQTNRSRMSNDIHVHVYTGLWHMNNTSSWTIFQGHVPAIVQQYSVHVCVCVVKLPDTARGEAECCIR